jgi:hypothetical protein
VDILRDVLKRRRRSFGPAFEMVGVLHFMGHAVIPGVQVKTFDVLILLKGTVLQSVVQQIDSKGGNDH